MPIVGGKRLPVRLAEELALGAAVEPQPLGVDLGDAVSLVENDEALTHRRQHARVAGIAGLDGRLREIGLGDVVTLAEDTRNPACLVPDGFIDEVEEDLLRRSRRRGLQAGRDMAGNEAFAVRIGLVQPFVEALPRELGKHLAHGPADEATVAEQTLVGRVDELEPVLRAMQDGDESRSLLEQAPLPLGLRGEAPLGHDLPGDLVAGAEQAGDGSDVIPYRRGRRRRSASPRESRGDA